MVNLLLHVFFFFLNHKFKKKLNTEVSDQAAILLDSASLRLDVLGQQELWGTCLLGAHMLF